MATTTTARGKRASETTGSEKTSPGGNAASVDGKLGLQKWELQFTAT